MVKLPQASLGKTTQPLKVSLLNYQWRCVHKPQVVAELIMLDDGLSVHFDVQESQPLLTVTTQQEPPLLTCVDSAVEIFLAFSPFEHDTNFRPQLNHCLYTNIEINAAGICYAEYGMHRQPRQTYSQEQIQALKIKTHIDSTHWTCDFVVPRSLIRGLIGYDGLAETFGLNLYKISESAQSEHYISWQKIEVEQPNFHLPEFFSLVKAEQEL